MSWIDAHNHLHDARLEAVRGLLWPALERVPLAAAVVNGTREEDWSAVAQFARDRAWICPAFGIHPWYVATCSPAWEEKLGRFLDEFPQASVGEIGLDRWIAGHDLGLQQRIFRRQIRMAEERGRPVTIHCLRAWGALEETLRSETLPKRGFLLHAYSGPEELVAQMVRLGAYFSFSPYFLHERKERQRQVFRMIPQDRLLVETDAPDLAPPTGTPGAEFVEGGTDQGARWNSPLNIMVSYRALANLRGLEMAELQETVSANFERLFGGC